MATHPGQFRGISRGVFGLSSWDPLRQPGQAPAAIGVGRGAPISAAPTSSTSSGYESQSGDLASPALQPPSDNANQQQGVWIF